MVAKCHLLSGTFSYLVQVLLGFLCFVTLVVKRITEVPRRPWDIWFLDGLKLGIGATFGHFANIFLSSVIASSIADGDECQWYCINYVVDSTFGVMCNIWFLLAFKHALSKIEARYSSYFDFGDYGSPPSIKIWSLQLGVWLFIVLCSKTIVFTFFLVFSDVIDAVFSFLFSALVLYPRIELVVVMIIIPCVLNVVQFWVQDSYLKKQAPEKREDNERTKHLRRSQMSAPLLNEYEDDTDTFTL